MTGWEDQRRAALIEQMHKNVIGARRYINVSNKIGSFEVSVKIESQPTLENLNHVHGALEMANKVFNHPTHDITGCERLSNIIYLSIAEKLPDSYVIVSVNSGGNGVTVNFNHQNQKS